MNEEKKVSVIIPAYNEEDSIGRVLDGLPTIPMSGIT
jgi:glycosyltransferase involved in cell wall biosynthesis